MTSKETTALFNALEVLQDVLSAKMGDQPRPVIATAFLSVAADVLVGMSPEREDGVLVEQVQQALAEMIQVKRQHLNALLIERYGPEEAARLIKRGPVLP